MALARAGERRTWALASWAGAALLFAGMALDEALVIHEEFNGEAARAWFRATSPVQGTVVWLILLLPVIVGAMGGLLGWILARRMVSRAFVRLGLAAIGLWLVALAFEGTAKSVFIPLNLYRLEVAFEESAEALAPAVMCVAIWAYIAALRAFIGDAAPGSSGPDRGSLARGDCGDRGRDRRARADRGRLGAPQPGRAAPGRGGRAPPGGAPRRGGGDLPGRGRAGATMGAGLGPPRCHRIPARQPGRGRGGIRRGGEAGLRGTRP